MNTATKQQYKVARNGNRWFVIGCLGRAKDGRVKWMPVSSGFTTKAGAFGHILHQNKADRAAIAELSV